MRAQPVIRRALPIARRQQFRVRFEHLPGRSELLRPATADETSMIRQDGETTGEASEPDFERTSPRESPRPNREAARRPDERQSVRKMIRRELQTAGLAATCRRRIGQVRHSPSAEVVDTERRPAGSTAANSQAAERTVRRCHPVPAEDTTGSQLDRSRDSGALLKSRRDVVPRLDILSSLPEFLRIIYANQFAGRLN